MSIYLLTVVICCAAHASRLSLTTTAPSTGGSETDPIVGEQLAVLAVVHRHLHQVNAAGPQRLLQGRGQGLGALHSVAVGPVALGVFDKVGVGKIKAVIDKAHLGLFPRRRMGLYLPLGLVVQFARVPSLLVIGSWFALQLLYSTVGPINGTMAWWTHLAGFSLGVIFALLARAIGTVRPVSFG